MRDDGQVEFYDTLAVGSTERGLWVRFDGVEEDVFVPHSQIHDDSGVYRDGDEGTLVMSEYWANLKELI